MNTDKKLCELLPWYINGTLPAEELKTISDHLHVCAECSAELVTGMRFSQNYQEPPKEIGALEQQLGTGLDQLRQKLSDSEQAANTDAHSLYRHLRYLPRYVPELAGLAATVLIGLVLFSFPFQNDDEILSEEEFVVLTQESTTTNPVAQIIFEPGTTEREMRNLILDMQANIVENPSQTGVYRLQLSPEGTPEELLQKIRSYDQVRWAELESIGVAP